MRERPRSERLLAGNFDEPNHGRGTTGRGRKWTLISLPRAKPARFCRRASNCSVTGPMIGHEPLTPTYTNPPSLVPHVAIFNDSLFCPRTTGTQISCERDLPSRLLHQVHYLSLPGHGLRVLPFQRAAQHGKDSAPSRSPQTRPGNVPTALKITIDMLRVSGCGRHVLLE